MPTYVAFLRAINVTGRFLAMSALASHFRALGFQAVRTYINSGNVIFTSPKRPVRSLATSIEANLEPLLGFKSEVFIRSVSEVRDIAAFATLLRDQAPPDTNVNVLLLPSPPDDGAIREMLGFRTEVDEFVVRDRELYWLCRTSVDRSKFSSALLERRLKIRATLRREKMLRELWEVLNV